jgi:hypothetical protein
MKKKKDIKPPKKSNSNASEPKIAYEKKRIRIYHSFEEEAEDELKFMASLSPMESLQLMRKYIDNTYRMNGFNPENLPKKHKITIVSYKGIPR